MAPWIAAIGELLSNPETMEKVCNVLPELTNDFKEISLSYPDLVKEAEKLNQQNMDAYNEMCKIVLNELQKILDSGEAFEDERKSEKQRRRTSEWLASSFCLGLSVLFRRL